MDSFEALVTICLVLLYSAAGHQFWTFLKGREPNTDVFRRKLVYKQRVELAWPLCILFWPLIGGFMFVSALVLNSYKLLRTIRL